MALIITRGNPKSIIGALYLTINALVTKPAIRPVTFARAFILEFNNDSLKLVYVSMV